MKAEIISIGTELLLGEITNTNASYLSKELASLGIELYYHSTVGDNPERLRFLLKQALKRSDIIITTGGLGPTADDITVEVIAKFFKRRLVFNSDVLSQINEHFQKRNMPSPPINIRQAYLPERAIVLENNVGTAPGIILKENKKLIIALPGPPRELIPMFEKQLLPFLEKTFRLNQIIFSKRIKTTGLVESELAPKVTDLLGLRPPVTVGIYARPEEVDLKITAKAKNKKEALKKITQVEKIIRRRLGDYIFGVDHQTLEETVGRLLLRKKKSLSIAESCSGGLISHRITNIPGSSRYFILGVVAYANEAKSKILGVPEEILRKYGAVSREVASLMAKGIRGVAKTDLGLGITGIAGPGGQTPQKPLGLVFIALASKEKTQVEEFHFLGTRESIKSQSSQAALDMLRKYLLKG